MKDKIFNILNVNEKFKQLSMDRQGELVVKIAKGFELYKIYTKNRIWNLETYVNDALIIMLTQEMI